MAVLCTGTEVYITGSKFYNNVADGGGHIFISLGLKLLC